MQPQDLDVSNAIDAEGPSDEEVQQEDDDVVGAVVQGLVEHYQQAIHVVPQEPSYFHSDLGIDCSSETPPPELPPVLDHWLGRLVDSSILAASSSTDVVLSRLLQCYDTSIRQALFDNSKQNSQTRLRPTGIAVLIHYEMLVSSYWSSAERNRHAPIATTSTPNLSTILQTLVDDVARATAAVPDEKVSKYMLSNVIIPTLLRLLRILSHSCMQHARSYCAPFANLQNDQQRRCAVTLLAFGMQPCQPWTVSPSLKQPVSDVSMYLGVGHEESVGSSAKPIRLQAMDWKAVESDGSTWDDPDVGVASRVASDIWKQLYQQDGHDVASDSTDDSLLQALSTTAIKQAVLKRLGVHEMAKAVRAHFFGRDTAEFQAGALAEPTTRLHLGRQVTRRAPTNTQDPLYRPYQTIPSRVHVVLHFVSLLDTVSNEILNDVLPCCYELLSAADDNMRGLGAAAVYHLLQCKVAAAPSQSEDFLWTSFLNGLLPPLTLARRTTRAASTLAMIGLAEVQLFQTLQTHDFKMAQQMRRQATQHWFLVLQKNSSKEGDPVLWGILVGALLPLLADHIQTENADVLELGRLGLTALLPLLETDDDGFYTVLANAEIDDETDTCQYRCEIRVLAVLAVGQLLVAAHPIMPRHGGKIASALAACLGHAADEQEVGMVQQVAARALVVCGESAAAVWNRIVDPASTEKFDAQLVERAKVAQQEADKLLDAGANE